MMKSIASRLFLPAAVIALIASGCTKQPASLTSPTVGSPALAPLIGHSAFGRAIPGSYIVVFKSTPPFGVDGLVDELAARHGFLPRFRFRNALQGFSGMFSPGALRLVRSDPRVAYVEENQEVHIDVIENNATWGIDRIDQRALPLSGTYTYSLTGAGVDAYIIDTGIRFTHSEFGGRAVAGIDEVTVGGSAADQHGHGTHVAGTVGGATFGVAKGVRLIAVRVLDAAGSGTIAGVTAGVDWVTNNHTTRPAVANMSLGGGLSPTLDAAVRNSIADGVVYCVAAGNAAASASNTSPADVAEAITVGASDITDTFASFSNFGPGVDVIAPGVSVTSSWLTSDIATAVLSGTSMATPHVAGTAALFLEANPGATAAQVAAGLVANATPGLVRNVPAGEPNLLLFAPLDAGPPPPPPPAPPPAQAPPPPTLTLPANGATGASISPVFIWNASSGATVYEFQLSTSSTFATLFADRPNLTTTSTVINGLANSTAYFWRVNAGNGSATSAFSPAFSFTTLASSPPPPPPPSGTPPPVPTLLSPSSDAQDVSRTPALSWNASTGATAYRVQVSTSSSFTPLVYNNGAVTGTSVTLPLLGSRVRYFWRVSASNSSGTSAFSSSRRFETAR